MTGRYLTKMKMRDFISQVPSKLLKQEIREYKYRAKHKNRSRLGLSYVTSAGTLKIAEAELKRRLK